VLMDTNDRGTLDVERFDLEPARPLLHARLAGVESADVRDLGTQDAIALLLRMVDADTLSPAMQRAIGQIGRSLCSWPQLASGVMLGGALVTDTARRILLDHPVPSGRYHVDLEELIPAPGHAATPTIPSSASELLVPAGSTA
jgi:hypothetical protein